MTKLEIISKEGKFLKEILLEKTSKGIKAEWKIYPSVEMAREIYQDKITGGSNPKGYDGAKIKMVEEDEEAYWKHPGP